jgi:hypothetical protein
MAQRREWCMGSSFQASPGHGWRCSDRAVMVKKQRRCRSVRVILERSRVERRAGRGAVEDGKALPLCMGRGWGPVVKRRNGRC